MDNSGRFTGAIEPWEGTGYPLNIFVDKEVLIADRQYHCTRPTCGGILREPVQLGCPHRVCKQCFYILCTGSMQEYVCPVCDLEGYDGDLCGTRTSSLTLQQASTNQQKWEADTAAASNVGKMEVVCPYECGETKLDGKPLRIKYLQKHMDECPKRLVACLQCSEKIKYCDWPLHASVCCTGKPIKEERVERRNATSESISFDQSHDGSRGGKCQTSVCPFGCIDFRGESIDERLNDRSKVDAHTWVLKNILEELQVHQNVPFSLMDKDFTPTEMTAMLDKLVLLECRSTSVLAKLDKEMKQLTREAAAALREGAETAARNRSALSGLEESAQLLAAHRDQGNSYSLLLRHLREKTEKQLNDLLAALEKMEKRVNLSVVEPKRALAGQYQQSYCNGRLIERIERVQAKRNEIILSQPFYTDMFGYKMCAKLYMNGNGDGRHSHVSLFFVVMRGRYDCLLSWPFQHNVMLKLRSQVQERPDIVSKFRPDASSASFARPDTDMNVASGCPRFVTQETLFHSQNGAGYVVDDVMFIEIVVDNSNNALSALNESVQEVI